MVIVLTITTTLLIGAMGAEDFSPLDHSIYAPGFFSSYRARIVNGTITSINQHPYQVSIELHTNQKKYRHRIKESQEGDDDDDDSEAISFHGHNCGGSVLSNYFILTAGHCMYVVSRHYSRVVDKSELKIRAGSSYREHGGTIHNVDDFVIHENFRFPPSIDWDIAIIKVREPLYFGDAVQPIQMVQSTPPVGAPVTVSGWGRLYAGGPAPFQLMEAEIFIVNRLSCYIANFWVHPVTTRMVCACVSGGCKGACHGDSGGPLVYNGRLAGIVSWGKPCSLPGYPNVFTDVSYFREWIYSKIGTDPSYIKPRIVNGINSTIELRPYQVSIEANSDKHSTHGHICGGSIISKNYVLTAAHCFCVPPHCKEFAPVNVLKVRVGTSIRGLGGSLHPASAYYIHRKYNFVSMDFDVAVLKVRNAFKFSKTVKPVPMVNKTPRAGAPVVVSGWGQLYTDGPIPEQLQEVKTYVVDRASCQERFKVYMLNVTDRMLCAGVPKGGEGACLYDSGGPLVSDGKLVGIVSWLKYCAVPGYPDVYTDVAYFRKWVTSITGNV